MKYKMISEYGNAIYEVSTERQKAEFERKGYKVMESKKPTKESNQKPNTKKAVKKGD